MTENNSDKESPKVIGLQRTVSLTTGISVIVGIVIGSGIFVSPKGVLAATNSVGLCLILWLLCGILSLCGALCFVELGLLIPESGGEMAYLLRGFSTINKNLGKFFGFMYAWSASIILKPTSIAVVALVSATYLLKPIIGSCGPPTLIIKLTAFCIISLACCLNMYSVKLVNKIMVILTFTKVFCLVIIIIGGIVRLFQGHTNNFKNSFAGTSSDGLTVVTGFFNGLWAYEGWHNLNYITEELINPKRNLPLALFISVPMLIVIYILVNVSYFTVMTKTELLASDAVAVTWSTKIFGGYLDWLLPLVVFISTLCTVIIGLYAASRINYVSAREGFLIKILSMVNIHRNTPAPSVMFTTILALIFLSISNLDVLVNIFSVTTWLFYGLCTVSLIIMRFTMKSAFRLVKVPIVIPIFFLSASAYLVVSPFITKPKIEYLEVLGIEGIGVLFFFIFVYKKRRIPYFNLISLFLQNLLQVQLPNRQSTE